MSDAFFDEYLSTREEPITVVFTVPSQSAKQRTHVFRRVTAEELAGMFEESQRAMVGFSGEEANRIAEERQASIWEALIESVRGYSPEADALTGDELKAYFRGATIPETLPATKRLELVSMLRQHRNLGMKGYVQANSPDVAFRAEVSGGALGVSRSDLSGQAGSR